MQVSYSICNGVFNHTSLCEFHQGKLLLHLTIPFEEKPKTNLPSDNLKYYRQRKQMTTRQLAEKLDIVPSTVVSIFFFTFFLMSNISSKKLNDAQKLPPVLAAWLPVIMLCVISAILTYKALQDSKIMDMDRFKAMIGKWRSALRLKSA